MSYFIGAINCYHLLDYRQSITHYITSIIVSTTLASPSCPLYSLKCLFHDVSQTKHRIIWLWQIWKIAGNIRSCCKPQNKVENLRKQSDVSRFYFNFKKKLKLLEDEMQCSYNLWWHDWKFLTYYDIIAPWCESQPSLMRKVWRWSQIEFWSSSKEIVPTWSLCPIFIKTITEFTTRRLVYFQLLLGFW